MTDRPDHDEASRQRATDSYNDENIGVEISSQDARQAEVVLQSSSSKKIFLGTLAFIVIFPVLIVFLLGFF
ncbi:hypothetical protein [Tepidicaulis sp.]|uniref:hypothetical protein n=1 Tax=Tepidicaulis sp. TaxID=1920809 RepID=UPI003B5CD499